MSILNRIHAIDKKLVLAIVGVLIGLSGLYGAFHERSAGISIVKTNQTNVLDVHKPMEELSISFQGEDIQKENLNLRILTLRIENSGELDILQNYYDQNDIWGLRVENGDIIEARLVDSSSDYIKSYLSPRLIKEENIIEFEKIIFERKDFLLLRFWCFMTKAIRQRYFLWER